jgi:hypothetical protein
MIKLGNSGILLKVGSQDVQSAYLGSTLVYSASTTTTSTTTTTTSTTSTTTTTANPIPSGAYAFYDFGNVTSYPGSGSTVFDISGNSNNGTLVNSPTFSSTFGGELRLDNASSQRIDYSASFTPDTSVVVIWKNVDSTFSKDTGFPDATFAYGIKYAPLAATKGYTPILMSNLGVGNTYFDAEVTATDITQWHQWGCVVTSSGTSSTATNYLDGNASSATETKSFDRSGTSGSGTAYLGWDSAVGDRYANGYLMAYLQYNRALTTSELNSIYTYYSARFGGGTTTTTTTAAPTTTTTTTTAAPTTTTTTTAAPTTTTTTLANACYNQTTVTFTSDDNVNFRFGYTSCDGTQSTLGGSTLTPGSFTFDSSYCIRAGEVVAAPLGEGTVVTGVSQTSQCGTFTTTTTTTTAAPTTTTTTAGPTTTTTTTAAPTTTTTTLASFTVEYYLVAGGGGGGRLGGGGAGGGIVSGSATIVPGVVYSLTEGAGGYTAQSGSATTAFGVTAIGGAAGGGTNGAATSGMAYGGGGSGNTDTSIQTGSIGVYGYNGGDGSFALDTNGGGAGGAGDGFDGVSGSSGNGGVPLYIPYLNNNVQLYMSASSGGGGAATLTSTRGEGGTLDSSTGLGNGGVYNSVGQDGFWPGGGSGGHSSNATTINRWGAMGYIQFVYDGPIKTNLAITGSGAIQNYNSSVDKTYVRLIPPVSPTNGSSYTWTLQYG